MSKLNPMAVHAILKQVLFTDEETIDGAPPKHAIYVDGIVNKYAFNPERIAASKRDIDALLSELPDNFIRSKGGGWSFLNACEDRHGNLWQVCTWRWND